MKSVWLSLLLYFWTLLTALSQQTIYVDAGSSQGNGQETSPYSDLNSALTQIQTLGAGAYIISIRQANSLYSIGNSYTLSGFSLTFQNWNSTPQSNSSPFSSESCSALPQIEISGGAISAGTVSFNGVQFITANDTNNTLSLSTLQLNITNSCFQIDFLDSDSENDLDNSASDDALGNPPTTIQPGYVLSLQGNNSNVTLTNISINGAITTPPLISAISLENMQITNIIATSFPQIKAVTENMYINGFTIDGSNQSQSPMSANEQAQSCWSKIAYSSKMSVENIQITNLNLTQNASLFCVYQISDSDSDSDSSDAQDFTLDNVNFSENNLSPQVEWSLLFLTTSDDIDIVSRTTTITNINANNNTVTSEDDIDVFLLSFIFTGNMTVSGVTFANNSNFKFLQASPQTTELSSNLVAFQDAMFANNLWLTGEQPVISFTINPLLPFNFPVAPSTNISNITIFNNNHAKNFLYLENEQIDDAYERYYLSPRASLQNINLTENIIDAATVFTIQMFNLDFSGIVASMNNLNSANILQSSAGCSPLQMSNILVEHTFLSDSNIIYKQFDTSEIVESMSTDYTNNTTPIPYSVLITNFNITNSTFYDYSAGFKIKAAPLLFIQGCQFENLFFNSSSSLIIASDLLSLLSNIIFDSASVVDFGYTSYLVAIHNTNLTSLFDQSFPLGDTFNLNYAIGQLTNGLVFMYRIFDCNFESLTLNRSDLIAITSVSLNQSLVSIDTNYFNDITLISFQDSVVRCTTIRSFNFGYNELTQMDGSGSIITGNQVSFLDVTNNHIHDNEGSSFLKTTSETNQNTFIANNVVNNIQSVSTFISVSINTNAGLVLFQNNSFNNCYIIADPGVYRQLNFISIDNEMTHRLANAPPDFHFNNCNFTNIVIYKNHPLIKQYQNSFFVANLADDTFLVENSKFDNISIQYTHNLFVAITDVFQLCNTTFSNIENYDIYGSVYILATSILINNSQFINNTALVGNGGALYIDYDSILDAETDIVIQNSLFSNNIASEGAAFYYTTKGINFTATNNIFIDNKVSKDLGSIIYFYNASVTGLVFDQNQILFTETFPNYFTFFDVDSITTAQNIPLSITNLNVNINANASGSLFSIQNSNVSFVFDSLNVYNSSLSGESANELSIMTIGSGDILLQNSNISSLSANVRSLIDILCAKDTSTSMEIEGSSFSSLRLTHNPDTLVYSRDFTYTGIVHLSNRGGKTSCNNTLVITNTTFENLNLEDDGTALTGPSAVMIDYNGNFNVSVQNSTFQNLFSTIGPAIHLESQSNYAPIINITNNNFTNVNASFEGGAIFNYQNNLTLIGNQFISCKSLQRSGAALFSKQLLNFTDILQANTFTGAVRYASYSFQDNYPLGTFPAILNLSFFTPSYIYQNLTNNTILLSNFSGYDLQNVNISGVLIDSLNQIVYDTSASSSDPRQLSLEVLGKFSESRDCSAGSCILIEPNLPIKGNATEIIEGQVSYTSPEFSLSSSYFNILLRACINGELDAAVTGDASGPQCFPCLSGTYALDVTTDTECLGCPEHATCLGKNSIIVDAGYWRPNTSTIQILECRNSDACLGGFASTCAGGHTGFLCDSCDTEDKWVKEKNECVLCPSPEKGLLVFILVLMLTLGYQVWYIKASRISNSYFIAYSGSAFDTEIGRKVEMKITQGMYIHLLTTYSQIFAIITTFNIDFLDLFANFEAITETLANPSVALFSSSICSLIDLGITGQSLLYYRIAFVTASPILKGLLMLAFRLLYWRFKITEKRRSILWLTALCLFMLEQPSIAQQLFGYLSCIQIAGDPNYYLQSDLGYQCYTPTYYTFRNFLVIPGLLFYIGACPIFLIWLLWKNRKNLNDTKLRMTLGAVYNEYNPKAFYWAICLMATKLILIFLGSTLDSDVKTKALSIFIILYLYYALFISKKPYDRKDLYQAERMALIAYLITVFGSIYYKDNSLDWIQWVILVTITFLNIYVIGMLVWKIFKVYLYQSRDIIMPILQRFRGQQTVDIDFSNEDDLTDLDEAYLEKIEEKIFNGTSSTEKADSKDEESSKAEIKPK